MYTVPAVNAQFTIHIHIVNSFERTEHPISSSKARDSTSIVTGPCPSLKVNLLIVGASVEWQFNGSAAANLVMVTDWFVAVSMTRTKAFETYVLNGATGCWSNR